MTKWLAVVTGCVTGIALLGLAGPAALPAILLIAGAFAGPYFPRARKVLILGPALLLSILVLPITILNFREAIRAPFLGPRDFNYLVLSWCWLISPILIVLCITAVVISSNRHAGSR